MATGSVKSAERVLDIFELLADAVDGLTLSDVAQRLSLPKSSAHGLLHTLRQRGYVSLDDDRRAYHLGGRLWELNQAFRLPDVLARQALPVMRRIVDEFDEICQLAIRDGIFNVYLARVDCRQPIRLISQVGVRLYCHATGLGKALLACESEEALDRLYAGLTLHRFTEHTIAKLDELKRELRQVRALGYAEDRGEYVAGLRCIAVPVVTAAGAPVAALSFSIPAQRATAARRTEGLQLLRAAAKEIAGGLPLTRGDWRTGAPVESRWVSGPVAE
ncbi:MAG: IclR family transcriptional regulator [Chloroflexi bacterium]|nr:IclR family transcriptional regulator [Chloroflexota bacterium]